VDRLQREQGSRLRFVELGESRTTPHPGGLDRTADRVFLLADDDKPKQPWLLVAEMQAQHNEDKLDDTLVEVAQLRARAVPGPDRKGKYRVLAGMVCLVGECPERTLDMTLTPTVGTRHAVLVWNVARDNASAALDELEAGTTTWGILFWVALMKGAGDRDLVRRWLGQVRMVPAGERSVLRTVALCFAELAGCRRVWEEELENWTMTESPLVNSWIESSQVQKGREYLLEYLRVRFPAELTNDVVETINAQPSLPLLDTWFRSAVRAKTYLDFLDVLRQ
jgi:hypothetical protein